MLVAGGDAAAAVQVVVMLLLVWWMYDGYAWLTNAIATDRLRYRIALIGGMGGFLIGALAIPMRTRATDSPSGSPTSRSCSCTARCM